MLRAIPTIVLTVLSAAACAREGGLGLTARQPAPLPALASPSREPAMPLFPMPEGPGAGVASAESEAFGASDAPGVAYGPKHYAVLPQVTLSPGVEKTLTRIANAYYARTRRSLVVTSGTRDAATQAEAMHGMLELGGDVVRLYKQKGAARELQHIYDRGRRKAYPAGAVIAEMAAEIREQMARGVFISAHLRAGAVDVRSRDMSAAERRAFLDSAEEVGGVTVLEEATPPHYHLQLD